MAGIPAEENSMHSYQNKQKNRQIINARSLSLELAKQKHRLAAQLVSAFIATICDCHFVQNLIQWRNANEQFDETEMNTTCAIKH